MNLKDKLHELVYVPVKTIDSPQETGWKGFVRTKAIDGRILDRLAFYDSNAWGVIGSAYPNEEKVVEWLKPTEQSYVLTGEELLELKKKWANEVFMAGWNRGFDQHNIIEESGNVFPDIKEYTDNLTI